MHRLVLVLVIAACGNKPSSSPSPQAPAPAPAKASLTQEQCTAAGGKVVGDIGDGAIHRDDYRCPDSGQPPLGHITPAPGGPVAIEGSVCCR